MPRIRNRHLLLVDTLVLSLAPAIAYTLRFEGLSWVESSAATAFTFIAVALPVRFAVYLPLGLYSRLWRFASVPEAERLFLATILGGLAAAFAGAFALPQAGMTPERVPISVLFMSELLGVCAVSLARLGLRVREHRAPRGWGRRHGDYKRVLIAGAGAAGNMLVKELFANPRLKLEPVGFVDDDPTTHGHRIANIPVFGPLASTPDVIRNERIDELVIAMPRAPGTVVRPVVRAALEAGATARTIPGLYEILSGDVKLAALREVQIQDLLRREPITTDMARVRELAAGRTVLVTGAGGSIGSELARQVSELAPCTLVLLDHAETPVFHIFNELRERHPGLHLVPLVADIRDRNRVDQLIEEHRPFVIFHAAAHKHVPLMEQNPVEAVTTNVVGTRNLVRSAGDQGVEHFVLISTDKAVRPTSVMGATKRIAEHLVRHAALAHGKNYVAVRFGNVLGSQGSVIPIFMEQIRRGGPVTVTHPDMCRYFMTIPEAVQLVLQAAAMGAGGELFMLDMGEPVKIVDLATDLIRLSGFEPGEEIEIQFSGIRPGEKLYEELYLAHEQATGTDHPKVLCVRDELKPGDLLRIERLVEAAAAGVHESELRHHLLLAVPDYAWPPADGPSPSPARDAAPAPVETTRSVAAVQ